MLRDVDFQNIYIWLDHLVLFVLHFIYPLWEIRAALHNRTNACWVFSCFRNPRNSDMDCRIFNVRRLCDHSRACVHRRGLVTLTASQHNILDSEKTLIKSVFLVLLTGLKLGSCMECELSHHITHRWHNQFSDTPPSPLHLPSFFFKDMSDVLFYDRS